jgi:hypothetical protein
MTNDDDILEGLASTPDPEIQKEFDEAAAVLTAIEGAKESGMEAEFMTYFLRSFKAGRSISESIWDAQCEWDL